MLLSARDRAAAGAGPLRGGIDRFLDRVAPRAAAAHGIAPLAARRLEATGRSVPDAIRYEAQVAALANVLASRLLAKVRAAVDGPLLVFKGPEIAARYPGSARSFADVDVVVDDARRAQLMLRAAGFVQVPDSGGIYVGIHHLPPLCHPAVPLLAVEVHREPKWPRGRPPPTVAELFEAAVPSVCGVDGVAAPAPEHHALLLAAHGWEHEPLRRVRDVLDVALAKDGLNDAEIRLLARRWQIQGIWDVTCATADALFLGFRRSWPMRTWARHLADAGEQTVLEHHLQRWLSPNVGTPPARAVARTMRNVAADLRPAFDDTWPQKLDRTGRALLHAFASRAAHEQSLGAEAAKGQHRNAPVSGAGL